MRLISINSVDKGMALGKALHDAQGNVLLPAGLELRPFVEQIKNLKIRFLYINDAISQGIEAWPILSEATRQRIPGLMRQARQQYSQGLVKGLSHAAFGELAAMAAGDIFGLPETRIDVTELSTNSQYPFAHELNVAVIAGLAGRMLGMSGMEIKGLCLGGLLHSLGEAALPDGIREKLARFEPLTPAETHMYWEYPAFGYDAVKHDAALPVSAKAIVAQHRENYDGTGFPLKKAGIQITLHAKIAAVAHAFEELRHGAGLGGPLKPAADYIQNHAGAVFDPDIAAEFAKNVIIYPNGTVVWLNDGRRGIVAGQNLDYASRPIIRVLDGPPATVNLLEEPALAVDDIEI